MNEATKSRSLDALFSQYIDVINRVISQNRDSLYGKAVKLWGRSFGAEPIAVGVYKHEADDPRRWYTVKLSGGRFTITDSGMDPQAKIKWRVKDDHLEHVVDRPDEYAEHPLKLDLDWLKTRVGLG